MHRGCFRLMTLSACVVVGVMLIPFLSAVAGPRLQRSDPGPADRIESVLVEEINTYRLANGLSPLAQSTQLSDAAQAHADDMVAADALSEMGSDGSRTGDRVARAGYGSWPHGSLVGENYYESPNPLSAVQFWQNHDSAAGNLLQAVYREVGIGHRARSDGWHVVVVTLGAQPNVLPVFINNSADSSSSPDVELLLTNEEAVPQGQGEHVIGRATEVMMSNSSGFEGGEWQPYHSRVEWRLESDPGTKTVWVRFRDARDRTTESSATIRLDMPEATAAMTATAEPTSTSSPTATKRSTFTAIPTATERPTSTTSPTATERPTSTSSPTATPTASSTSTRTLTSSPSPTATRTPTPTSSMTPTPTANPTPSSTATLTVTPTASPSVRPTSTSTPRPPSSQQVTPPALRPRDTTTPPPQATAPTEPPRAGSADTAFGAALVVLLLLALFLLIGLNLAVVRRGRGA